MSIDIGGGGGGSSMRGGKAGDRRSHRKVAFMRQKK